VKSIQTQLQRAFWLCIALQIAAVAFMTIPQLEAVRANLAGSIGLSSSLLWLPIGALLSLSFLGVLKALSLAVANPMETLAHHARDGELAEIVLEKRSSLYEEDTFKRFFEKQTQKVSDIKGRFDDLESSLAAANEQVASLASLSERQARELEQSETTQHALQVRNKTLAAENEVLESTLETERKSKIGREVKMRAEEIYQQMERAVAQASAQSIWIPNLIEQLKTPAALINDLSQRLESTWKQTSIDRLGQEIAEIRRQSDLQRSLLDQLAPEELLATVPEAAAILEAAPDLEVQEAVLAEEQAQPVILPDETSIAPIPLETDETQTSAPALSLQIEDEPQNLKPITLETEASGDLIRNSDAETEASETIEIAAEALPVPAESDRNEAEGETETLTALQTLVFELVKDYSEEVENVSVDAFFSERVDMEVDEELLESVLSNLIEIAIYQWKEGSVKLSVTRNDNQITFAVDSQGKPLEYGEFDETQTNRIESALNRKIAVDMPSANELRMRYKYTPEEN